MPICLNTQIKESVRKAIMSTLLRNGTSPREIERLSDEIIKEIAEAIVRENRRQQEKEMQSHVWRAKHLPRREARLLIV